MFALSMPFWLENCRLNAFSCLWSKGKPSSASRSFNGAFMESYVFSRIFIILLCHSYAQAATTRRK